jgi:hypothetical protein
MDLPTYQAITAEIIVPEIVEAQASYLKTNPLLGRSVRAVASRLGSGCAIAIGGEI